MRVRIPWAVLLWIAISGVIFVIGLRVVTLRDTERFPYNFQLTANPTDQDHTVHLTIVAGTFEYGVRPEVSQAVETGVYLADTDHPVALSLFSAIPNVVEVRIDEQTITIAYDNDIEADLMLRRAQRPVINSVLNTADHIEGATGTDQTLIFTTSDAEWRYGHYIPALIPEDEQEVYPDRASGEAGSALAQFLFENVNALEALTLNPDSLVVTYRATALETQVISQIELALNQFHPRASLLPNLWIFSITGHPSKIIQIMPIDTDIPLVFFTLGIALLEGLLFAYFYAKDDKIVRPMVRLTSVFLLFWSIYGHEPLWDYGLGLLFPNSNQLVHPSATVIQFTAQHLELVLVSSLIIIPVGLIFGILVTRDEFREVLPLVNNLVNSGQTVPTIAIVAFMAPIIGFGFWPAIIALIAYGLLPVVRNTIAGLEAVDDFIIDSARGMGLTPSQILCQIEVPIASSVIMAGIRTSMVINVGTATLGAFVGSGGLGTPIASGLSMTVDSFILLGAIPAALLAIMIDYILERIEYVLTPRGLQIESGVE